MDLFVGIELKKKNRAVFNKKYSETQNNLVSLFKIRFKTLINPIQTNFLDLLFSKVINIFIFTYIKYKSNIFKFNIVFYFVFKFIVFGYFLKRFAFEILF